MLKKVKVSNTIINELVKQNKNFVRETPNSNIKVFIKTPNAAICVYTNNTITFQGKNEAIEYKKWFDLELKTIQPGHLDQFPSIGSDESGSGDVFGPLVIASAYIESYDQYELLTRLGVQDSKNLSNIENIALAKKVKEILKTKTVIIHPPQYNKLHASGINLNALKVLGHYKALTAQNTNCNYIIDQFTPGELFWKYLKNDLKYTLPININNYHFFTKAESKYMCVAAASVVARAEYLEQILAINKKFSINLKLGSSKEVDLQLLEIKNTIDLNQIAKLHFKNVKSIL